MIGELTYMRRELLSNNSVSEVKGIDNDMIIKFNADSSDKNQIETEAIATEILEIVGRYDCQLSESEDSNYEYVAKFESDNRDDMREGWDL